ncbi:MAG: type II toxin-antitoxin system VapC family toxin [Methylobacterium mesophilicum]|nr:type II toxin-antitoxin system VapC family toxin [Methylobacterium mesophilicum]
MVYVDPSAIIAIFAEEDDAESLLLRLHSHRDRAISVVGLIEAGLGLGKIIKDYDQGAKLARSFCEEMRIEILAVPVEIFEDVMLATVRYGKGTGHPAKLNFGDRFSYAFTRRLGTRILFKGNDFAHTDLDPA